MVIARVNCGHTNVKTSAAIENYLDNNMNVIPLCIVFMRGFFSCNDNHIELTLPNTRIRAVVARTTYSTAVTGYEKGRGIMPDYKVIPTLEDRINRFDREMEVVLDQIRQ